MDYLLRQPSSPGDPAVGEFTDAVVLKAFGEVPVIHPASRSRMVGDGNVNGQSHRRVTM